MADSFNLLLFFIFIIAIRYTIPSEPKSRDAVYTPILAKRSEEKGFLSDRIDEMHLHSYLSQKAAIRYIQPHLSQKADVKTFSLEFNYGIKNG